MGINEIQNQTDPVVCRLRCHQLIDRLKDSALEDALDSLLILNGEMPEEFEMAPPPPLHREPLLMTCEGTRVVTLPPIIDPS